MTQTTVTTSLLVYSLLSFTQVLNLLLICIFICLSFTPVCSCLSSVAAINLFRWKCKSVISWFMLTAYKMVDIAQIGFSQSSPIPPCLRLAPPLLFIYSVSSPQKWIVLQCEPEDDSSNTIPVCNSLCVTGSVFTCTTVFERERKQGEGKQAVSLRMVQLPSGLRSSKHGGWTK